MEGITVLSETILYDTNYILLSIICGMIILGLAIDLIYVININIGIKRLLHSIILILLIGIFIGCEALIYKKYIGSKHINQQLLVDDSVSINEFMDHYKLLRKNDKIYFVEVLDMGD